MENIRTFGNGEVRGDTLQVRLATAFKFNQRIRNEVRKGFQNKVFPKDLPIHGQADDCDMGKWLKWELTHGEKSERMRKIDTDHREFHRLGHIVIACVERADETTLHKAWSDYLRLSESLGNQLFHWMRELA